jgi:hypothetical protein
MPAAYADGSVAGEPHLDDARRNHLLSAIRCASLRLLLSKNELDNVGVALRGDLIDFDLALDWLEEIGAMPLIDVVVEQNRV